MRISKSHVQCLVVATLLAAASAVRAESLTAADEAAIRVLSASYLEALFGCHAEEFADLFVPASGAFMSGFRGRMVGREQLILLVQSERHCTGEQPARPGGANPPTVAIEATPQGARGIANLGTAEYQDEYAKTPSGWKFASRTVIVAAEKTAGLDAHEMLAIQKLAGARAADHYEPDPKGVSRLLTSGVRIGVAGNDVTGRVFLRAGGYDDEVYEKVAPGQWRVKSSSHVP